MNIGLDWIRNIANFLIWIASGLQHTLNVLGQDPICTAGFMEMWCFVAKKTVNC